uniref:Uncharacterized protein n=1 Tax=Arthrobacter sp. J3.49 TaxID=347213 RepID=I3W1N1_9MICC|nr:hypothetical protein [Arthrobacter sp. J3.49]AFK89508.1 hypothetical protein [Arthrobacter sp. J3.49]
MPEVDAPYPTLLAPPSVHKTFKRGDEPKIAPAPRQRTVLSPTPAAAAIFGVVMPFRYVCTHSGCGAARLVSVIEAFQQLHFQGIQQLPSRDVVQLSGQGVQGDEMLAYQRDCQLCRGGGALRSTRSVMYSLMRPVIWLGPSDSSAAVRVSPTA